jgi:hypothetical protein
MMSAPQPVCHPSTLLRRGFCAVALVILGVWAAADAAELEPDQTYAGGTRVEASNLGLSFSIPAGWIGRFGQNDQNQVVVLGSTTTEGVGLAILQPGATAAELLASLNGPQDLGAGVVLEPTGPPVTQGSRALMRYQNDRYVGLALALVSPAPHGIVFIFAGPRKNERAYAARLGQLDASTRFGEPAVAAAPPPPAAPGPGDLPPQWANLLAGQALHYFSSYNSGGGGGGMASHRILHLCANGRFAFGGDSLVTMNVPGASGSSGSRDSSQGRWSLESPTATTAVLVLSVDGGRQLRWDVRYDGSKTFLNGQRWLREQSKACR